MNTKRSDALVTAFEKRSVRSQRHSVDLERTIQHPAKDIFALLCPTREYDWIPGWTCDLVYTTTGYNQQDCIFRTDGQNGYGPGVWVCCRFEQDRRVDFVRVLDHQVVQLKLELTPVDENNTQIRWRVAMTSLDAQGNADFEALPNLEQLYQGVIDMLVYYLDNGEMVTST